MQNLEQIRAKHALDKSGNIERKKIAGLPGLIINNGLLATAAFSNDGTEQRKHMKLALDAVAEHLKNQNLLGLNKGDTDGMLNHFASPETTSHDLQRATEEALAYLSYLKRFAN